MKPPLTDERLAEIRSRSHPDDMEPRLLLAHIDWLKVEVERLKGDGIIDALDAKIEMLTERTQRGNDALAAAVAVAEPHCTGYGSMCNCSVHKAIASIRALAAPDAAAGGEEQRDE